MPINFALSSLSANPDATARRCGPTTPTPTTSTAASDLITNQSWEPSYMRYMRCDARAGRFMIPPSLRCLLGDLKTRRRTFIADVWALSRSEIPWTPRILAHVDRSLAHVGGPPALLPFTPESKIDACASDGEPVQRDVRQPGRQLGRDAQPSRRRIGPQSENRLEQMEDASRRPGLRHVRLRIEDRKCAGPALDAGVELRQPVADEIARRLRDVARHPRRLGGESVAPETERDDAIVVRPHRAALVREGVVGGVRGRQRPDAPAAPQIGLEEAPHDAGGALAARNATPQAMAGVGCDSSDGSLVGIEPERIEAEILAPERRLEGRLQDARFRPQLRRARRLAERVEDLRHAHPRIEDIALQLAERLRLRDGTAVGIDDRVPGVFPAHVLVALRGARPVLLKPVAVEVAVAVDPVETAQRRVAMRLQERLVAEPLPRLVQYDEVARPGGGGSVVRRVGDQPEVRQLAGAQLVRDLSRLGVALIVDRGCLELGELPERAAREAGVHDHVLQARDQRVAAEDRHEPRHAGGRQPDVRGAVVVV